MTREQQPEHNDTDQLRQELAEARAELAKTREELADIRRSFDQTPVLIAILKGPTHVFEFTNAAYLEVVAPGRNLLGMSIREFMPEQEHEKVVGYLDGVYRTGVPFVGKECGFEVDRQGDGRLSTIYFDFIYHPIRDAEGRIEGVLVQAVDVTDKVLARDALRKENERIEAEVAKRTRELEDLQGQRIEALEQADKVKDEFLSIISHELRTPMTTIRNAASILAKGRAGEMNEDQQRFAQLIQTQSDRLTRLLDDLLDLQRLRSDGITYDCRPTDVREVATQVAQDFEPLAVERGIQVTIALGDEPLVATVDQDRLAQVLVNLLSNAVKFTPAGGTITVRGSRTEGRIRLDVEDTGVGIPETDLTRIFDKFVQLDASLQQRTAGIGLGLTISRQIVEDGHRGRLLVTSELGRGSCFSVELPSED